MKRRILRLTALILALLLAAVPLSSCHPASDGTGETELPEILVGSDEYEPFFYAGEGDSFTGFDVELATEAFRRVGVSGKICQNQVDEKRRAFERRHDRLPVGVLFDDRAGE